MKKILALVYIATMSGCVYTIEPQIPLQVPTCSKVYGHADLYRTQGTTIRVKQSTWIC